MNGNWVRQTTASEGTGPITLSAVAGYPTANTVFGLRRLYYEILTSAGLPLEVGEGYLSSPTVLVRERVWNTFDGANLSFSNSPAELASGTKTVVCAPASQAVVFPGSGIDTSAISGGSAHTKLPGNLIADGDYPAITLAANVSYMVPFYKDVADHILQLGVRVTTASTGKFVSIGIFDRSLTGFAGRTICSVTGVSVGATGESFVSLGQAQELPAGWYWYGVLTDGTPGISGATTVQHAGGNLMGARRARYWTRTNPYGPYGADAQANTTGSVSSINNLAAPMLIYK